MDNVRRDSKTEKVCVGLRVWLLIQNDSERSVGGINIPVYKALFEQRETLVENQPMALLIDSPGGDPAAAYKLAKMLIHRCGDYHALVPSYAKSAATLVVLGAGKVIFGRHAELGPLDIQLLDDDNEKQTSALNHVQSLEQLRTFAMETLDISMNVILEKSGKKISSILPNAIDFTTSLVKPLFDNVDVVNYTEMSRTLKVGEDYAVRLLERNYKSEDAISISKALVTQYPDHRFVIDQDEVNKLGLKVEPPTDELSDAFTTLLPFMDELTVIGALEEIK